MHMGMLLADSVSFIRSRFFRPPLSKGRGHTANNAQVMSVTPLCLHLSVHVRASVLADRLHELGPFLPAFQHISLAGFALLAGTNCTSSQHGGLVLAAIGFNNVRETGSYAVVPRLMLITCDPPLRIRSDNIYDHLEHLENVRREQVSGKIGRQEPTPEQKVVE